MGYRLIFAFLFCTSFYNYSQSSSYSISVLPNSYVYGGAKISHYAGGLENWDYQSILNKKDQFIPFHSILNSGPPESGISWVYFELSNPQHLNIWMNMGTSRLNEIRVFCLDDNLQAIDTIESGLDIGQDYRSLGNYKFSLPIMSESQENGKFLVGFRSVNGLHETSISFGTKDQLFEESYSGNAYTLVFSGICLILIFYNLVLAGTIRDRIYLFYSLNLIGIFLSATYAVHFPFISMILGEKFTQNYVVGWIWFLPMLMAVFTSDFFDLKKSSPKLYIVLWAVASLSILNLILTSFLPTNITAGLMMVFILLFYGICTLVGYDQIRKKHPLAILYFTSWVIVFIGLTLYFMVAQLGLFYSEMCYYSNYITASIEALLFSIALGKRYQIIMEREKETAELLVKKNETLVMANESLDSFNYHVSHDLKTILVNTISLNNMIKKYTLKGKTDKVIAISDRLDKVAKKGEQTVKGFLSLAEAGKIKEKEQELIHFTEAITELIESNGLDNIMLIYDTKEFESLYFNSVAFNSIFLNLLTNSKKYSKQNPEIHISLIQNEDTIEIVYSDNGIGVNLEKYGELIFSPFRRVENSLEQEGSGVGLFLVKRIIDEYGGTIIPHSAPNEGLTFVITLPKDLLEENNK